MCGFAGFLDRAGLVANADLRQICYAMGSTLRHRGPDDDGVWIDEQARLAFAHRRLSIVDLSPRGSQPMHSASGRYVIAYNGEIYNFRDIRVDLENCGHRFRGDSDTEVVLNSIAEWGITKAARKFVGMFAFSLWDREEQSLYLVRDRLGIKPLYFGAIGTTVIFASELRALEVFPGFLGQVDRTALGEYLRHGYVPSTLSIYQNVHKLRAGHIIKVGLHDHADLSNGFSFWSVEDVIEESFKNPFRGTLEDAVEELEVKLASAVKSRMVADVPLGAFLSGGYDSSTVVALMQSQSHRPVKTFSIGFDDSKFDEAVHAKAVAKHLGTDHTELYVTTDQALRMSHEVACVYDEPFADASHIPTLLVSRLARHSVTVCLSGDGGDEVFCGYNRHLHSHTVQKFFDRTPRLFRSKLLQLLIGIPPRTWDKIFSGARIFLPKKLNHRMLGDKIHKIANALSADDFYTFYITLFNRWADPASIVLGKQGVNESCRKPVSKVKFASLAEQIMYWDTIGYLPDDILTKVDRASMAVGLEARVPLLDHRVVEFAWSLPLEMKAKNGQGKIVLRKVLDKYVPSTLSHRPKMGFSVPIGDWLRGPLREWAETLLHDTLLLNQGYIDPKPIRHIWNEHMAGRENNQDRIWAVLMFQAWLDESRRRMNQSV